jgi:hypothetical protein
VCGRKSFLLKAGKIGGFQQIFLYIFAADADTSDTI